MTIHPNLPLPTLVDIYRRATHAPGDHPTPEHAGLAAVLEHVANEARYSIARNLERYDHRSLYEFAAAMDYAIRESPRKEDAG
jgi:hypothetical protein